MTKNYPYSGWRSPLGIVMCLTFLVLGIGMALTVAGVQHQTSTRTEAAKRTNPFVFRNPKSAPVGGSSGTPTSRKCKVYLSSELRNTSSRTRSVSYTVEAKTLNGQLADFRTRTTTLKPKQRLIIGAALGPNGILPGQEYNPRIRLHNIPETTNRPNYRTWQSFRMPNNCEPY